MSKKDAKKFIVKLYGRYWKAIYVTRSRKCLVFEVPGIEAKRTFPIYSKEYHFTAKSSTPEHIAKPLMGTDDKKVLLDDENFRQVLKKEGDKYIFRLYQKGISSNLEAGINLGSSWGLGDECKYIKKDYIIINLDEIGCKSPNISILLFSPTSKIDLPNQSFIVYSETITYSDIIVILRIIDGEKFAEHIRPKTS